MTFQRWSASSVSQFIADRSSHYSHGDKACRKIINVTRVTTLTVALPSTVSRVRLSKWELISAAMAWFFKLNASESCDRISITLSGTVDLTSSRIPRIRFCNSLHSSYGLDIGKNTRRESWQDRSSPPLSSSLFSESVELYRPPWSSQRISRVAWNNAASGITFSSRCRNLCNVSKLSSSFSRPGSPWRKSRYLVSSTVSRVIAMSFYARVSFRSFLCIITVSDHLSKRVWQILYVPSPLIEIRSKH